MFVQSLRKEFPLQKQRPDHLFNDCPEYIEFT